MKRCWLCAAQAKGDYGNPEGVESSGRHWDVIGSDGTHQRMSDGCRCAATATHWEGTHTHAQFGGRGGGIGARTSTLPVWFMISSYFKNSKYFYIALVISTFLKYVEATSSCHVGTFILQRVAQSPFEVFFKLWPINVKNTSSKVHECQAFLRVSCKKMASRKSPKSESPSASTGGSAATAG